MYKSLKHIIRSTKIAMVICFLFLGISNILSAQKIFDTGYTHPLRVLSNNKTSFTNAYDAIQYKLYLEIDPRVNYINGSNVITFKTKQSNFSVLEVNLANTLTVDSVKYHAQNIAFTHTSNIITAQLPITLVLDIIDSVTVYYHGAPVSTGMGTFTQNNHNGTPIIWTLSEPYGSPDWWPCKHDLNDKADSLDVTIKTPQQYTAVSNGLLADTAQVDTFKVYHWKHRYAITPYLVCIAVTNYSLYIEKAPLQNGDTVSIHNYAYPENLAAFKAGSSQVIPVMQLYSNKLGTYPFIKEKYGQVQFGWGGGMEHQTATFLNNTASFDLVAHELAHHWFGDKVTCGSWADIWLNEGFATYMAAVAMESIRPDLLSSKMKYALISVQGVPNGTIYVDDTTNIGRIFNSRLSYNKGSLVLHMLRFKLGDSLFFSALRNYLQDTSFAYKNARTADLKRHLENVSGQNLTTFFNQWVFGFGIPSYTVYWHSIGSDSVYIKIEQTSEPKGLPFFELPVPITFKSGTKGTNLVLNHTYSGQEFRIKTGFFVESLAFDPDQKLITIDNQVFQLNQTFDNTILSVYPNPANNEVMVYSAKSLAIESLTISDTFGNSYISLDKPFKTGENTIRLYTQNLAGGMYFIKAKHQGSMTVKKLLIIK